MTLDCVPHQARGASLELEAVRRDLAAAQADAARELRGREANQQRVAALETALAAAEAREGEAREAVC